VKPGVYRFTHLRHRTDWEQDAPGVKIYSRIEWIGPPEEPRDYLASYRELNLTAGQVLHSAIRRYPTLYGHSEGAMLMASNAFLAIGSTRDWHPNGFPINDPHISADETSVDISAFDQRYPWYPLAEYSAIYGAAGLGGEELFLNDSFVALARNVLNCMATHGITLAPQSGTTEEEQKDLARRCLAGLNQKYPQG
jgi:hypothetical protein